jgi:hypothetical protein
MCRFYWPCMPIANSTPVLGCPVKCSSQERYVLWATNDFRDVNFTATIHRYSRNATILGLRSVTSARTLLQSPWIENDCAEQYVSSTVLRYKYGSWGQKLSYHHTTTQLTKLSLVHPRKLSMQFTLARVAALLSAVVLVAALPQPDAYCLPAQAEVTNCVQARSKSCCSGKCFIDNDITGFVFVSVTVHERSTNVNTSSIRDANKRHISAGPSLWKPYAVLMYWQYWLWHSHTL